MARGGRKNRLGLGVFHPLSSVILKAFAGLCLSASLRCSLGAVVEAGFTIGQALFSISVMGQSGHGGIGGSPGGVQ